MSIKDRIAALNKATSEQSKPNIAVKKDVNPPSVASIASPVSKAADPVTAAPKTPTVTQNVSQNKPSDIAKPTASIISTPSNVIDEPKPLAKSSLVSNSPFLNKPAVSANSNSNIGNNCTNLNATPVNRIALETKSSPIPVKTTVPIVGAIPFANKLSTPITSPNASASVSCVSGSTIDTTTTTVFAMSKLNVTDVDNTNDTSIRNRSVTEATNNTANVTNGHSLHMRSVTDLGGTADVPVVTSNVKSLKMNLGNIPMPGMGRPMSMPIMQHRMDPLGSSTPNATVPDNSTNGELVHVSIFAHNFI